MSNLIELIPDNIVFYPEAEKDFLSLDKGRQIKAIKALQKISQAPSIFGKSLENHNTRPLAGFRSIYVDKKALRIICTVSDSGIVEVAIVAGIAERDGMYAYNLVSSRKIDIDLFIDKLHNELINKIDE